MATMHDQVRMVDLARLRAELIWIYQGEIDLQYRDTQDHHPGCSGILLRRGTLRVETEGGVIHAREGDWVFPREGQRIQQFSEDALILSLHFNLHWPGGAPLFDWDVAFVTASATKPALEQQAMRILKVANKNFPGARADMVWYPGNILTHFLLHREFSIWLHTYVQTVLGAGMLPSRLRPWDERLERAIQTLDELPPHVSLDKTWLSREAGLSPSQLDRLFQRHLGVTSRQYFENRRITHAKELLKNTAYSIKQIADEVGVHSQPFFSRWFRKHTGMTPSQYAES